MSGANEPPLARGEANIGVFGPRSLEGDIMQTTPKEGWGARQRVYLDRQAVKRQDRTLRGAVHQRVHVRRQQPPATGQARRPVQLDRLRRAGGHEERGRVDLGGRRHVPAQGAWVQSARPALAERPREDQGACAPRAVAEGGATEAGGKHLDALDRGKRGRHNDRLGGRIRVVGLPGARVGAAVGGAVEGRAGRDAGHLRHRRGLRKEGRGGTLSHRIRCAVCAGRSFRRIKAALAVEMPALL